MAAVAVPVDSDTFSCWHSGRMGAGSLFVDFLPSCSRPRLSRCGNPPQAANATVIRVKLGRVHEARFGLGCPAPGWEEIPAPKPPRFGSAGIFADPFFWLFEHADNLCASNRASVTNERSNRVRFLLTNTHIYTFVVIHDPIDGIANSFASGPILVTMHKDGFC